MIHIIFVAGSYGTMIEYLIRNNTLQYKPTESGFDNTTGSMHNTEHMCHMTPGDHVNGSYDVDSLQHYPEDTIVTWTVPAPQWKTADVIHYINSEFTHDKKIIVRVQNPGLCLYNQYKKIVSKDHFPAWRLIWPEDNASKWMDGKYKKITDMPRYELREWMSFDLDYHFDYWLGSTDYQHEQWLTVNQMDIVYQTKLIRDQVIAHCGLSLIPGSEDDINKWCVKNLELDSEYQSIEDAVSHVIDNKNHVWRNNIITEAIMQKMLRDRGYEIRCYELNDFPNNALELHQLIYK